MKASELRIGNLVTINNPEHWPLLKNVTLIVGGVNKCTPLKDVENTDYGVQLFDNSDFKTRYSATKTFSQFICFIEPIPLTEEWLLKFCFDKNFDFLLRKKGFSICFEKVGNELNCYLESIGINIQYVHQLQNLYFSLVGEELELKQ